MSLGERILGGLKTIVLIEERATRPDGGLLRIAASNKVDGG